MSDYEILEDYNFRVGNQPFAIIGATTPFGNVYCAKCINHVEVLPAIMGDESLTFIFRDQTNELCFTCNGCNLTIGKAMSDEYIS